MGRHRGRTSGRSGAGHPVAASAAPIALGARGNGSSAGVRHRDIDVEGDLADGFRRAWRAACHVRCATAQYAGQRVVAALAAARLARSGRPRGHRRPKPGCRAVCTPGAATGRRSPTTTTCPTSSTHCCSTTTWPTRRRTSPHEGQTLHDAQTAKLDLICRKLDLRAGSAPARCRLRLGLPDPARGRAFSVHATGITLSAQQRDSSPTGSTSRASPTASRSGCRTTANSSRPREASTP